VTVSNVGKLALTPFIDYIKYLYKKKLFKHIKKKMYQIVVILKLQEKQKFFIIISIGLSGMIFSSLYFGTTFNSLPHSRYTQEDIDNASIAYVDVKINSTIQTNETHMYKTWHTGGDYLTLIYKLEPLSNSSCYVVHDQNLMAGGSVSIGGEGTDAEITTYKMKNEEGWFYFYIYRGLPFVDMENAVDMETIVNYTFVVSSDHLNYRYPTINIPNTDI